MEGTARGMRALWAQLAPVGALVLALAPTTALAAPRSIEVRWQHPTDSAPYVGVVVCLAASQGELTADINVSRVYFPGSSPGAETTVVVDGLDDQQDYSLGLRTYDANGNESPLSARIGQVTATAPSSGASGARGGSADPPLGGSFESYRAGQDPAGWLDSGSGTSGSGDAALFETIELADGSIAFGTTSTALDIHSHYATAESASWSTYEYSGRLRSETLDGEAGVTVLSQLPMSLTYYRLARSGAGAFALTARGVGEIACASSTSSGVAAQPGVWQRFRVRVTRFDSRNRIRAMVYADGVAAPGVWQLDCWDVKAATVAAGTVGVYASGAPGTVWDDLAIVTVASDGAPPGYVPASETPSTPTSPDAYTSRMSLVHWWVPGRDTAAVGRDFAWRGPAIDAGTAAKGIGRKDVFQGGTATAFVDLDGSSESLGNKRLLRYGIGDSWTLAAWVQPKKPGKKKPRYIVDLNGQLGTRSQSRISLVMNPDSRFTIEITDASGRLRSLSAILPVEKTTLGQRWYHVVAVKSGSSSLRLYVDGRRVASTDVGVPLQGDVERALRVGTRVKGGVGYGFAGGVGSIALWSTALAPAEVRAVYADGKRGYDPR